MNHIKALLFDKDGTLFDFHATWSAWTAGLITELSRGDMTQATRLATAIGYDLPTRQFHPHSPVIAGTPLEISNLLSPLLPDLPLPALTALLNQRAAEAPQTPPTPLIPLLNSLRYRGLPLGLATNDAEAAARAHLTAHNITHFFDFIAGYDSGHPPKPAPDMLLAFATHTTIPPQNIAMIGDSPHDLQAARAANMTPIAVLTGPAPAEVLAPLADAVLPHIGHIPALLDTTS